MRCRKPDAQPQEMKNTSSSLQLQLRRKCLPSVNMSELNPLLPFCMLLDHVWVAGSQEMANTPSRSLSHCVSSAVTVTGSCKPPVQRQRWVTTNAITVCPYLSVLLLTDQHSVHGCAREALRHRSKGTPSSKAQQRWRAPGNHVPC